MSAREEILSTIRDRRANSGPAGIPAVRDPVAHEPTPASELVLRFEQHAKAAAAQVRILGGAEEIPAAISDVLRSRNLPAAVHLPPDPLLELIPWNAAPGLSLIRTAPGGDDVAVSIAAYAIAETGTLVFPASPGRPPSWHFRPGVEIALLAAKDIHADLEAVLAQFAKRGALPSTVNLVTGPSRTGDIEQTLELGAHGPKQLMILIVPSLGGNGT